MPTKITRSAKTGKFVTKKAAARKPNTTVTETVGVTYKQIERALRFAQTIYTKNAFTTALRIIKPMFETPGPNPKKKKV